MYLVDTNVWLERLLDQEKSEEVRKFLEQKPAEMLYLTDFALHSIGLITVRLGKIELFRQFLRDAFLEATVEIIHLDPEDLDLVAKRVEDFRLDFDDAYQYVAAEKENLTIVSFDRDFDRTSKGRKTPAEAIKE
jgi:uncharacterized protein